MFMLRYLQHKTSRKSAMMPDRSTGFGGAAMQIFEKEHPKVRDASGTHIFNLPFDVLRCIHDRLNLLDYMSFRSVSKLSREVVPALEITTAIARFENQNSSTFPWLISFHEKFSICRLFHPSFGTYSFELPEVLQGATSWYCKDGWLLIGKQRGDNFSVSFFNPLTKNVISYQECPKRNRDCTSISFSSPPTSQNCVIVVLMPLEDTLEVHICQSREKGWVFFQFYCGDFCPTYESSVFANGAFYFGSFLGRLGVLSLQGEDYNWKIIEHPQERFLINDVESFLAERNGEVFVVLRYDYRNSVPIRVLKLDPSIMSWKKVENLGNDTLYVSSTSLFMVAKTTEAENTIYFLKYCREHFVFYSLSTNRPQFSGSMDFLKSDQDTLGLNNRCWIKPTWS